MNYLAPIIACLFLAVLLPEAAVAQNRAWELMDELDEVRAIPPSPPPQPFAGNSGAGSIAEPQSLARSRMVEVLRRGDSVKEVLRQLGEPDRRLRGEETVNEEWFYGSSIVFFEEGSVSGWSDSGELSERGSTPVYGFREKGEELFNKYGWKNAWQREEVILPEDVIAELLDQDL